jgi:DNA replication protein DnaC
MTMRTDVLAELKALRLHGMAQAWGELQAQGNHHGLQTEGWLIEHLLRAEHAERHMRSIAHQMKSARFPLHRDLAGFDFTGSVVDRSLVEQLSDLSFTEAAHNVVLIGGPGTGKTHLAIALGVAGVTRQSRRVRFYSTVDLVNALEQEKAQGKAGRIAQRCSMWIWWCWMNWGTCHSARPVVHCCFTCCPNCTNTPVC